MKTNQWSRFLTEAGVISLIIVYSYAVYLFGEMGALNAIGINDATALLTLDVQSILIGFLSASMYFIVFLFLMTLLLVPALKAEPGSEKEFRRKRAAFIVTMIIIIIILGLIVYSQLGKLGAGVFVLMSFLILAAFVVRMPGHKKSLQSIYEGFLERILLSNSNLPRVIRIGIPSIIVALLSVPILNYYTSYGSIALQPGNSSVQKVTEIDDETYWVARVYSDKYIRVRLEKGVATPSYMILNINDSANTSLNFSLKEVAVDTQKLHPRTVRYQKFNEHIKQILNL